MYPAAEKRMIRRVFSAARDDPTGVPGVKAPGKLNRAVMIRCLRDQLRKHRLFVHTKALVGIVPSPYSLAILHTKCSIFSEIIHLKEMSPLTCCKSIKIHFSCPDFIIAYTCGIKWTFCPSEYGFP